MDRASKNWVMDKVVRMIRNGATEEKVRRYVDKLFERYEITSQVYQRLLDMIIENY